MVEENDANATLKKIIKRKENEQLKKKEDEEEKDEHKRSEKLVEKKEREENIVKNDINNTQLEYNLNTLFEYIIL